MSNREDPMGFVNPLVPRTIDSLLPKSEQDYSTLLVVSGARLLEALMMGKEVEVAARESGLTTEDAVKLLATEEFARYAEAYANIGDVADKAVRIRIAKSILAAQIANGETYRKREPMDILEYVRKEQQQTGKGGGGVNLTLNLGGAIKRPYAVKSVKQVDGAVLEIPAGEEE
jgi:hypothetical protein